MYVEEVFSIKQMEEEFSPAIDTFLGQSIPGLWWPKLWEKNLSKDSKLIYFLFFNERENTPLAFSQCEVREKEKPSQIIWKTFTVEQKSFVVDLHYMEEFIQTHKEIVDEVQKRFSCQESIIYPSDFLSPKTCSYKLVETYDSPKALVKNHPHYQSYISSFSSEKQALLKRLWRDCHKKLKLEIGEYNHFKEVFHYRPDSLDLYQKLKKDPAIKEMKSQLKTIRTIHYLDQMVGMLFFFEGVGKSLYCYNATELLPESDILIPESFFAQLAVFTFYDFEHFNKLYLLPSLSGNFENWNLSHDPFIATQKCSIYKSSPQSFSLGHLFSKISPFSHNARL